MRLYPAIEISPGPRSEHDNELLVATLDDGNLLAIQELEEGSLRAFFSSTADRDRGADAVRARFPNLRINAIDVPDENWAERSQAALKAIQVGEVVVAPPWDIPPQRDRIVVIQPSMGFGTGHHATTRLCLIALQEVDPAQKTVIDVGTGSGVLAIAAAKLGADRVVGIDNDADALINARENQALNGVSVDFRREDLSGVGLGAFDIVLANLTGAVLLRFADRLMTLTRPGGTLIVSGLRQDEEPAVLSAFEGALQSRMEEEGWVCLRLRRGP